MTSTPGLSIDDIRGMKQLRRVAGLLSFLHGNGCDRDKAGNRELHFDDYVLLVLLYLFNPLIDSMRTLQKVADLPEVRKRLGIGRFSLGSFSESCRVFEPAMLQQVVGKRRGTRSLPRYPEQADAVVKRLVPTLGCLTAVTDRMQKTAWKASDLAYVAAWKAHDALHEPMVRPRYQAIGNPGAAAGWCVTGRKTD